MSEERLQEIKDSVNFQREILLAHNMGTLCVDEEQELIEEIERLHSIINETKKGLDKFYKEHSRLMWTEEDYIEFINCIDRELKGSDKE